MEREKEAEKKWSKRRVNHGQSECGWLIGLAFASITALYTPMTQPGWQAVTHLLIDSCSLFTLLVCILLALSQTAFLSFLLLLLRLSLSLSRFPDRQILTQESDYQNCRSRQRTAVKAHGERSVFESVCTLSTEQIQLGIWTNKQDQKRCGGRICTERERERRVRQSN